ncbi:SgcJ/EcaC family oxidoreductase [Rhodocytophaga rosea]|uniref:SgcJ/EcaC family oxidoreductase n=1 Tax=Rhodocytophaga rosea TaxID=2704465 RepID=A0A6C0GHW9_9BACT|nr:SgcJ/EcaC family oxidoreductase [Rhodocytophaga rosea]QHT67661.1 SgcJ/EcaC family oxidoreductase [Rhodocytophaga rosea]
MKIIVMVFALIITATVHAQTQSDTMAIQAILQEEVFSWNKGDAQTYSRHFAEDGTFTNIMGMFYTGHKNFLERHEQIFKGVFNKTTIDQKVVSLQFLGPDAAIVETLTWVSGFSKTSSLPGIKLDEKGRLYTRLLQVMVKEPEGWKITAYHNVDLKPGIPVPEAK